ncbi:alpha-(1,3)-fucosyltransferase C-like [Galleria mellonella]|uniref:Fucosyltransferase n=1 Tax=Galleria mellonella TaxID=7137 RepID=A0A6J1WKJ1_GALME|nr:alpha-(1,3)-fucosyltransferase C-like [Galleria mellonella]
MYLIMKTETFAKLFFLISFTGLVMYAILAFYTFHTAYKTVSDLVQYQEKIQGLPNPEIFFGKDRYDNDLKYILIWTVTENAANPFGDGQLLFISNSCPYYNCYITTKKTLLKRDYRNFDAIIFDVNIIRNLKYKEMPRERNSVQKYIFYGKESADDMPMCSLYLDNYFNWTWSYKLNSDIVSPFVEVRDLKGNVVAPSSNVKWIENMTGLTSKQVKGINSKSKAVAWVIHKCYTRTIVERMTFAKELQHALKEHALALDVYGCKMSQCPEGDCLKAIERDYYFYLAYEDSITEDYVTSEVLKGYNYGAVPIVYGGANYHHFLPEGSYIKARSGNIEKLAAIIDYSIRNPSVYRRFFRWRNHYTIHKVENTSGVCKLCEFLNDEKRYKIQSVHENFRKWWYTGPLKERCYPRGAEKENVVLSYMNNTKHILILSSRKPLKDLTKHNSNFRLSGALCTGVWSVEDSRIFIRPASLGFTIQS